ncbi:adenylate/guanylate cyclase domain-containing protein [Antarcticirhabdus aurantiaca]|uniref:Adenylate/guanylate cyclase domain-containing protein n=1 Tax=Antarcticirhabdus aurantiaca TaxID=2606717 RepID=A0ACD4NWH7_9HYPH|nr:adenylate/guanylate cyclase domain-containing protein [Antarcticirhabdus aurantiaca]WAJ31232.1 adenylate/guanylate cyclase domain-containing protein [Jeongeuplla avenae]
MVAIDAASGDPVRIMSDVETRSELRTALWRFVTLAVFAAVVWLEPDGASHPVHLALLAAYAATSLAAVLLVVAGLYRPAMSWIYVSVDAALVVYLVAEHMFVPGVGFAEALATPSLAIAFVLLAHAGLRMRAGMVAAFAVLVALGTATAGAAALSVGPNAGSLAGEDARDVGVRALAFAAVAAFQTMLAVDIRRLVRTAVSSTSEKTNLSRFFSPDTAERIAASGFQMGLVRQRAAILFVDIRGFTGLAEEMEPEEIGKLLTDYRRRVVETVAEWEGSVDKFMGDGVMAVFAIEDEGGDLDRAFRCARDLVHRLETWSDMWASEGRPALTFGMGLHVGPVVGGVVAGGSQGEHTVLGDTVNLAARLQQMSKSLGARLVVSSAVVRGLPSFSGDGWRLRRNMAVPGRSEPVDVAFLPYSSFA